MFLARLRGCHSIALDNKTIKKRVSQNKVFVEKDCKRVKDIRVKACEATFKWFFFVKLRNRDEIKNKS